ncbi:hypothetical protein, partial [Methylophilus aquaticus]
RMSFTLNTCPQHPRQLKQNRKIFHLKLQRFCPTKRGHLSTKAFNFFWPEVSFIFNSLSGVNKKFKKLMLYLY